MKRWLWLILLCCAGCGSGAVVFAPTPLPPDLSPLRYEHPSGAFAVTLPRNWAVHVQNTSILAEAAFSVAGEHEAALSIAVINLGTPIETANFGALIDQYQREIRPDVLRYTEQNRQAMGDGSWRITGLRTITGGATQALNTFIDREGALFAVIEVVLPADASLMTQLQDAVNSVTLNPQTALTATELRTLSSAAVSSLSLLNVAAWRTPQGVLFVTGEVANYGDRTIARLPVRAVLITSDGLEVSEAVDVVMGHGIAPGGFAPFSLRFGAQPANTATYRLELGAPEYGEGVIFGADVLAWTDSSTFDGSGQLIIAGTVSNCSVALVAPSPELAAQPTATPDCGTQTVQQPRVTVTVFDASGNVIAAGFVDLAQSRLAPGDSAPYQVAIPEIGGEAVNYIVNVQALP